jgi:hypothetical protein
MEESAPKGLKRTPGLGWYSKTTCFEFHKLLVSALIANSDALLRFRSVEMKLAKESCKNPELNVASHSKGRMSLVTLEEAGDCAQHLWECGYLLWRISDSRMLRHHLRLLDTDCWLIMPTRSFASGLQILTGRSRQEGDRRENQGVDNREDYRGDDEANQEDKNQDNVKEDDDDQSEEFWRMKELPLTRKTRDDHASNLDTVFLRWMQLLVNHWIAQDILTSPHVLPPNILQNLNISILDVKYPLGSDRKMEPWETVLKDLQPDLPTSFDVQAAIDTIERGGQPRK